MCIPILTSATVKPARPSLARRVPVVPGRPCPSRPSRRRVRRARRACRHRRPRRARRPRPAHGDPHSSREPPGPTDVAISAGTPRTPSSGFRDPEMSRMCRGPTVDSKNAGIHTRTPGRRGPTVVDRGPRDDLPPAIRPHRASIPPPTHQPPTPFLVGRDALLTSYKKNSHRRFPAAGTRYPSGLFAHDEWYQKPLLL